MNRLMLFPLFTTLLLGAERLSPVPLAAEGPRACVALEPRLADEQGQVWIYRQTPFGVARLREAAEPLAAPDAGIRAVEQGDAIRFERSGPFGTYRWQRGKSELNAGEQAAWARALAAGAQSGTAAR